MKQVPGINFLLKKKFNWRLRIFFLFQRYEHSLVWCGDSGFIHLRLHHLVAFPFPVSILFIWKVSKWKSPEIFSSLACVCLCVGAGCAIIISLHISYSSFIRFCSHFNFVCLDAYSYVNCLNYFSIDSYLFGNVYRTLDWKIKRKIR